MTLEVDFRESDNLLVDLSTSKALDVDFVDFKPIEVSFEKAIFEQGLNGFSPIATVEQLPDGAKITVIDLNGTTTAEVKNGSVSDVRKIVGGGANE